MNAPNVIPEVRRLMKRAAHQVTQAVATLRAANRILKAHPDYRATDRAEKRLKKRGRQGQLRALEAMTLTRWFGHCIESILGDVALKDAASCLREDLFGDAGMGNFVAEERRSIESQRREVKRRQATAI